MKKKPSKFSPITQTSLKCSQAKESLVIEIFLPCQTILIFRSTIRDLFSCLGLKKKNYLRQHSHVQAPTLRLSGEEGLLSCPPLTFRSPLKCVRKGFDLMYETVHPSAVTTTCSVLCTTAGPGTRVSAAVSAAPSVVSLFRF